MPPLLKYRTAKWRTNETTLTKLIPSQWSTLNTFPDLKAGPLYSAVPVVRWFPAWDGQRHITAESRLGLQSAVTLCRSSSGSIRESRPCIQSPTTVLMFSPPWNSVIFLACFLWRPNKILELPLSRFVTSLFCLNGNCWNAQNANNLFLIGKRCSNLTGNRKDVVIASLKSKGFHKLALIQAERFILLHHDALTYACSGYKT